MKIPLLFVLCIFWIGIAIGILLSFIGISTANNLLVYIAMGIISICGGFHIIFVRCPNCGKYLGRSVGKYCPRCGKSVF